jgi:hypothetical protein
MMSTGTGWLQVNGIGWLEVDGIDWYKFTVIYLIVTVLQWFHHLTLIF